MSLFTGQAIDGRILEDETSLWTPERFASLCNALSWAVSDHSFHQLPVFTTRRNAKDSGIDAEWQIELPNPREALPAPLLGPGWNVFQYKQRDLKAQARNRIISNLKSSIKDEVQDLLKRQGRRPNRYVLFVNIDLKADEQKTIQAAIGQGLGQGTDVHVQVVCAGQLAAWLNDNPHLRACFFGEKRFRTWQDAYEFHKKQAVSSLFAKELVGNEKNLQTIKEWLGDPATRAILISGPSGIGKSRIALEAANPTPYQAVQVIDPRTTPLEDYRGLCSGKGETICIVDDPEPETLRKLLDETLALKELKLIITLPVPRQGCLPNFGYDERVRSLSLSGLSQENARKLIAAAGVTAFEIEDWIIQHAGGNPGILLVAASVGDSLRRGAVDFAWDVGQAFEERLKTRVPSEVLECARLLSLLTHVGITGAAQGELETICRYFGSGQTVAKVLSKLEEMEKAGVAARGGSFVWISIPLIANYFAAGQIEAKFAETFALFADLSPGARLRFITRLSDLDPTITKRFWDEFFAQNGPFGSLEKALSNPRILGSVAAAVPEQTLQFLETTLKEASLKQRLVIAGETRSELIWAIEQLLFRRATSKGAMRLLWLLAEAESEHRYGNNATGILAECFFPTHPQLPLPLTDRIDLLKEFISDQSAETARLVAIKAAAETLSHGVIFLRHSKGLLPLDSRPTMTYAEIGDYLREILSIFMELAKQPGNVGAAVVKELPKLAAEIGSRGLFQEAVSAIRDMAGWVKSGRQIDVPSLFSTIERLREAAQTALKAGKMPQERIREAQETLDSLKSLEAGLEGQGFLIRLKRWAGPWHTRTTPIKDFLTESESEMVKMAKEAVENPPFLDVATITWLLTPEAEKSHTFFFFLGKQDSKLTFKSQIESLGQKPEGAHAFSAYWAGWAEWDRKAAEARLEELSHSQKLSGLAILQITVRLGANEAAVVRIKQGIETGLIDPEYAARVLQMGGWLKDLTPAQFEILLKTIVGKNFEYATGVIELIGMWLHLKQPLEQNLTDFAWGCLETDPLLKRHGQEWEFDRLAARLAEDNFDRALNLFDKILKRGLREKENEFKFWNPLALGAEHHFYNSLRTKNPERLLELLIRAATTMDMGFVVGWQLKDLLDQETDKASLIAIAKKDIELARTISDCMVSTKPGFWPIVFELFGVYPNDAKMRSNLVGGLLGYGTVIEGHFSKFYEERKQEALQKLRESSTPQVVKNWLQEVVEHLDKEIARQIVWEYDEDIDGLRRQIEDKNSDQRLWAIGRVLKYAEWEDIKRLLKVEDIEEALSQVDLPEKKRQMLQKALEVWRYGK